MPAKSSLRREFYLNALGMPAASKIDMASLERDFYVFMLTSGYVNAPGAEVISDTFTGTVIDTNKWASSADITQNNQLIIPCTGSYLSIFAKAPFTSLTGVSAQVRVVQTAANESGVTGSCGTIFTLETLDPGNSVRIERAGESIAYGSRNAGVDSLTYTPWNIEIPEYWRITESGGTVSFQSSDSGSNWSTFGTIPAPSWAADAVYLSLKAGHWEVETNPTPAIFDNVNVVPLTPTPGASTKKSTADLRRDFNLSRGYNSTSEYIASLGYTGPLSKAEFEYYSAGPAAPDPVDPSGDSTLGNFDLGTMDLGA